MKAFKPTNNHGSIVIRFRYQDQNYTLSRLGSWKNRAALTRAEAIAHQIYMDCLAGKFAGDPQVYLGEQVKVRKRKRKLPFLQVWDSWVASLNLPDHTRDNHYKSVRIFLHNNGVGSPDRALQELLRAKESLSAATWNKRRSMLKSCCAWAIQEDLIDAPNPFEGMKASSKKSEYEVMPFTKQEVQSILAAAAIKHPHYLPFIQFLFTTGCRTGEAIGLKWSQVNFENKTITIVQTKTESSVLLHMPDSLFNLLDKLSNKLENNPFNSHVFTSPEGRAINSDNFRFRVWKPLLTDLKLKYRPLYQTRHTVLSHIASEQGLLAAAAVAGHKNATMVTRHYAKFMGKIVLPEIV